MTAKGQSEKKIQYAIMVALGCEPGLILLRNNVFRGRAIDGEGKSIMIMAGLGIGSPDLVGLLTRDFPGCGCDEGVFGVATWFALEVKRPEDRKPDEHQVAVHKAWREAGAFVGVVTSIDEARAALARARRGGRE